MAESSDIARLLTSRHFFGRSASALGVAALASLLDDRAFAGAPRPLGAWLSYGVGSENRNFPAFVVMISQGSGNKTDQPLFSRLWGSGFLPTQHQGVRFRSGSDPVLYLSNPPGIDADSRRAMLDATGELNRLAHDAVGDPEINARIAQYEMAFRQQTAAPDLTDLPKQPK